MINIDFLAEIGNVVNKFYFNLPIFGYNYIKSGFQVPLNRLRNDLRGTNESGIAELNTGTSKSSEFNSLYFITESGVPIGVLTSRESVRRTCERFVDLNYTSKVVTVETVSSSAGNVLGGLAPERPTLAKFTTSKLNNIETQLSNLMLMTSDVFADGDGLTDGLIIRNVYQCVDEIKLDAYNGFFISGVQYPLGANTLQYRYIKINILLK